jgi:thiosulfate/3-mercaptopyruvate sulfurtransferase
MSPYQTLIDCNDLTSHLDDPNWAILDCRFDFRHPAWGQEQYVSAHIPGAFYAHIEKDLALPVTSTSGRHPLPGPDQLAEVFSRWGIAPSVQVVAYDGVGGSYAARAWWCLRYMSHTTVAVLDGGWQAWRELGMPVRAGAEQRKPAVFVGTPRPEKKVELERLVDHVCAKDRVIVDSRSHERYLGLQEELDPIAGHVPGAINLPWAGNLDSHGRFLPPEALRKRFQDRLGDLPASAVIFYCGSGVTACHNILAMTHAGLGEASLYPGSWSEWIRDPARPVALGEESGGS